MAFAPECPLRFRRPGGVKSRPSKVLTPLWGVKKGPCAPRCAVLQAFQPLWSLLPVPAKTNCGPFPNSLLVPQESSRSARSPCHVPSSSCGFVFYSRLCFGGSGGSARPTRARGHLTVDTRPTTGALGPGRHLALRVGTAPHGCNCHCPVTLLSASPVPHLRGTGPRQVRRGALQAWGDSSVISAPFEYKASA